LGGLTPTEGQGKGLVGKRAWHKEGDKRERTNIYSNKEERKGIGLPSNGGFPSALTVVATLFEGRP